MSNVHELKFLKDKIKDLKEQGVYRKLPTLEGANEAEIILNGKKVINLSSNNYLGFANHPRLKEAAVKAVEKYGIGSGAVRTIVGNMDIHEELEDVLAQFKREEAVMVFQSGFNCNAGTIQAITEKGDLIVSDELNHASIIDGARLSRADKTIYKHNDMDSLEKVLKENREKYKNILIITDGVSLFPVSKPSLPSFSLKNLEFDQSLSVYSLDSISILTASIIAPTAAGGNEVLNNIGLPLWLNQSCIVLLPATYPPIAPIAFDKVPILKSTLPCKPKWSTVPRPFSPKTPDP